MNYIYHSLKEFSFNLRPHSKICFEDFLSFSSISNVCVSKAAEVIALLPRLPPDALSEVLASQTSVCPGQLCYRFHRGQIWPLSVQTDLRTDPSGDASVTWLGPLLPALDVVAVALARDVIFSVLGLLQPPLTRAGRKGFNAHRLC